MAGGFVARLWEPILYVGLSLQDEVLCAGKNLDYFVKHYNFLPGLTIWALGSRDVWQMQLQVLRDESGNTAIEFKTCTIAENNMIAITVSAALSDTPKIKIKSP